jgi:hypothetical protein
MIIKIRSLDSDIDISGMHSERVFSSDVENVGMPVDTNMLGNVSQIHSEMDEVNRFIDGDVGSVEILDELVDDGSSIN